MKTYDGNMKKIIMKELLSPYIGFVTWKNFKLVPLSGGGVDERNDMKHVNNAFNTLTFPHFL